jgi:hypothetical protein
MNQNNTGPHFADEILLAYIEGEVDIETAMKIERSPADKKRAKHLAGLQNKLIKRLYRMECPSSESLGEYELGILDRGRMVAVAKHLLICPVCRSELSQLREFLRNPEPLGQTGIIEGLRVAFADLIGARDKGSDHLPLTPAFSSLRGRSSEPLILKAEGAVITLEIQRDGDRFNIFGQVAADDQDHWTGAEVSFIQEKDVLCNALLDDLGAFQCVGIPPGQLELQVENKSGLIIIADIVTEAKLS